MFGYARVSDDRPGASELDDGRASGDLDLGVCPRDYFAFYVVEHYIDPGYKYAGLLSFLRYLTRRTKPRS